MNGFLLRLRRRKYAIFARSGFEGYVLGSRQHALLALLRPFDIPGLTALVAVAGGWGATAALLVVGGAAPAPAGALAGGIVAGVWVGAAILSFARDRRRAARPAPPPPRPEGTGDAGVREPRRPPPDPGIVAARRELPEGTTDA